MGGFTQDDGYVRGVVADVQRGILLRPCRGSRFFGVLLTKPNFPFITEVPGTDTGTGTGQYRL
jgi:hypothetical protein